jgi:hypothetical protein
MPTFENVFLRIFFLAKFSKVERGKRTFSKGGRKNRTFSKEKTRTFSKVAKNKDILKSCKATFANSATQSNEVVMSCLVILLI